MPVNEILNNGATSLAAANWLTFAGAAGSGLVNNATLWIQQGTQTVTAGLSPSLSLGLTSLDITPGFSGTIGGATGSLAAETDGTVFSQITQLPRVRYEASGGAFYYTPQGAGGASDTCHYFQVNGGGSAYLTGTGTVRRLELTAGRVYVSQNVGSVANYRWVFSGGSATIDVNTTTDLHAITVLGGQHVIKRGIAGTTITAGSRSEGLVMAGGAVTLDAGSNVFADIRLMGGTLTVLNAGNPDASTAGITNIIATGGTLDLSKLQRPMTVTLMEDGPGCTIITSKYLTITTRNPIGRGSDGLN
jgi:hypothetical protein